MRVALLLTIQLLAPSTPAFAVVSTYATPVSTSSLTPDGMDSEAGLLVVALGDGFQLFDTTDPSSVLPLGTSPSVIDLDPIDGAFHVALDAFRNLVFLVEEPDDEVHAFDISNPASPVWLSSVTVGEPTSIQLVGRMAYVTGATSPGTLSVIDTSNPLSLSVVDSVVTSDSQDASIHGGYAYVADGSARLRIYSAEPTLTLEKTWDPGFVDRVVGGRGDIVYIFGSAGNAVQAVDVSNKQSPHVVATRTFGGIGLNLVVNDEMLAVLTTTGIVIYTLDASGIPTTSPDNTSLSAGQRGIALSKWGLVLYLYAQSSALALPPAPTAPATSLQARRTSAERRTDRERIWHLSSTRNLRQEGAKRDPLARERLGRLGWRGDLDHSPASRPAGWHVLRSRSRRERCYLAHPVAQLSPRRDQPTPSTATTSQTSATTVRTHDLTQFYGPLRI